jgi:hypothetical protein
MTTKNITEHYKKYGVIEGDKLLLETAKNNYQKGQDDKKIYCELCNGEDEASICKGCYENRNDDAKDYAKVITKLKKEKAELIEKIKNVKQISIKTEDLIKNKVIVADYIYWKDLYDILDTFKSPQHEEIPAMGRTEDNVENGKTTYNSPEDIQSQYTKQGAHPTSIESLKERQDANNQTASLDKITDTPQNKTGSLVLKEPHEYLHEQVQSGPVVSNSGREGVKSSISNGCPPVNPLGCGKEFIGFNDKGKKIKAFCWDKDKLGDWRCPECRARDKK